MWLSKNWIKLDSYKESVKNNCVFQWWHSDDSYISSTYTYELWCVYCLVSSHRSCSPGLDIRRECHCGLSNAALMQILDQIFVARLLSITAAFHHSRLESFPWHHSAAAVVCRSTADAANRWKMKKIKTKTKLFSLHLTHNRFLPPPAVFWKEEGGEKKVMSVNSSLRKYWFFCIGGFR